MNKLGAFLRNERLTWEMTQVELGEKLGFSNGQFISNWERGRCPIPIPVIKKVCKILQLGPTHVKGLMLQDYKAQIEREL